MISFFDKHTSRVFAIYQNERTLLIHAAACGHLPVVSYVCAQGAHVNAQSKVLPSMRQSRRILFSCPTSQTGNAALHDAYSSVNGVPVQLLDHALEMIATLTKLGAQLSAVNHVIYFVNQPFFQQHDSAKFEGR